MAQTKTSRAWLKRHFEDPFVKRAHREGMRSRAAYKLMEIQKKDHLIQPGMKVIDLGAAPGGWSEIIAPWLKHKGQLIALDILDMKPIEGVHFIQGDFREDAVMQELLDILNETQVDVVLSDMSPNMSGQKHIDQPRMMFLAELALDFAERVLNDRGSFLIKIFQGEGFDEYLQHMRASFKKVIVRKPEASRQHSREVYLLGRNRK
jgi:23S rRNA (uridine2552-2'-O)-methyltransferase